jgi:predicted alpha/beta hydrolase family esterase
VIVLYGSGHAHWLHHFTESTPGFSLVEPADYHED